MKERLELFMQVCEGVEHAHQKAIIHRDLKPSNVLVVTQNDKPVPKIIDFGLAKAMAQRLTEKTMFTELGVLLGTPEYMSPEQADLRAQNIDTRTDVYSLGVILYELLVGALPFDTKTLRAAGLEAILRLIREEDPPKPSTKVRMMGPQSAASAEKRREEPQSLARHLQGDLDWITLKALEKDRARRYGTVSELSADLSTVLAQRTGRRRSRDSRLSPPEVRVAAPVRIGDRRRGACCCWPDRSACKRFQLHRTRLERDRANRERDRANRITDFMTGMFKLSDPGEARGNNVSVREILDKASADIDTSLTKDPELQAQMMFTMAGVYDNLGLYPRAQSLFERALELCRRTFGDEDDQTLKTMQNLAIVMAHQGHYDQTERLNRQLFEIQRRTRGPEDPRTLISMSNLAVVLHQQGQYAEAAQLNRQLLDIQRRVLGPEHRNTVRTIANLAAVLIDQGQFAEAEKLDREALEIQQKAFGADNPDAIRTMSTLAIVLYNQQKYAEAENWNRQTLESQRRVYGPEHPWTLLAMNTMAAILTAQKKYADAEKMYRAGAGHPTAPSRQGAPRHSADDGEPGPHPGRRAPVRRGGSRGSGSPRHSAPGARTAASGHRGVHLLPRLRHGSAGQQGRGAVAVAAGGGQWPAAADRCEHGQGYGAGAAGGRRAFRGARRSCQGGRRGSSEAQVGPDATPCAWRIPKLRCKHS